MKWRAVEHVEGFKIEAVLKECKWNKTRVAEKLGVSQQFVEKLLESVIPRSRRRRGISLCLCFLAEGFLAPDRVGGSERHPNNTFSAPWWGLFSRCQGFLKRSKMLGFFGCCC